MNNEELLAKYKALFLDNVEAIVVRKDDYDRLYGNLTIENIELKQEIEKLNKCIKDDKENANEIMAEQQREIERLNNIINELEKYLNEEIEDYDKALNNKVFALTEKGKESYEAEKMCFLDMLDKLQELKGSDKE